MADDGSQDGGRKWSRREWLSLAGIGSSSAALMLMNATFFRSLHLSLLYEPSKLFRVGKPEHYPLDSVVKLPDRPVFICRDREGLYAISAVCTHLGCIVRTSEKGFACPCHGSRYDPSTMKATCSADSSGMRARSSSSVSSPSRPSTCVGSYSNCT